MRQTALLDGPGRHLQSVTDKWMVDTALAVQQRRMMPSVPHQQAIGERLQKELLAQSNLPNWCCLLYTSDAADGRRAMVAGITGWRESVSPARTYGVEPDSPGVTG